MATWGEFQNAEPVFAARVRAVFAPYRHHTMATLRLDGSPRISGTEVEFTEDDLVLGVMGGARRVADLRHDPRIAIHSHSTDPGDDPTAWPGEAKVAGSATEVIGDPAPLDSHRFRVELSEVVFTRVAPSGDLLVVESWHPGRGLERIERS